MTIILGYFQYMNIIYIFTMIPLIIQVVLNFFILRSSKTNLGEKERPELLYYIGIINIIFLLIRFVIPLYTITGAYHNFFYTPSDFLALLYVISYGLILSLPFLITYGILMLKYWKVNEQRFNSFLKFSSLLWIISFSSHTILLGGHLTSILLLFLPWSDTLILTILTLSALFIIFDLINLVAWILLIVHSVKNNDKNLMISGILAIVVFGISYLYSLFFVPLLIML